MSYFDNDYLDVPSYEFLQRYPKVYAVFENNYFVQTENVPACFKYQDAGTEKTLDFMKTEDFFNEITAAGGNYRFNPNGTPLLPAPKYTVSFVVTPAELANVVIKVNGQEVANPVDLEAGTYTVEVNAECKNNLHHRLQQRLH